MKTKIVAGLAVLMAVAAGQVDASTKKVAPAAFDCRGRVMAGSYKDYCPHVRVTAIANRHLVLIGDPLYTAENLVRDHHKQQLQDLSEAASKECGGSWLVDHFSANHTIVPTKTGERVHTAFDGNIICFQD